MKLFFISLSFFIAGFIFQLLTNKPICQNINYNYKFNHSDLKSIDTGYLFVDIFLNNLILCIFISFIGYISGGILTCVLLFWNGYILSVIFKAGLLVLPIVDVLFLSKHMPFEIFSILIFAKFGLKGFLFYKDLITKNKIKFLHRHEVMDLIKPTMLLLLASIIECL